MLPEENNTENRNTKDRNTEDNNTENNNRQGAKSSSYIAISEKLKSFRPGAIKTVKHYPTGIRELDKKLGGGLYPGLIFLGARPGMGKSTLALQIASEVAAGGTSVLFYSMEMPSIRIESKILNRAVHMKEPDLEITSDWLLRAENKDKEEEWEFVEEVQEEVGPRYKKLYVKEREKIIFSAEDIIKDVEKFIDETNEKPVVFIDYLQILSACSSSRNMTEKQKNDENINVLSSLSNKHDLVVFVISSLNREAYKNAQKPMQMDSFKETGGIEYSASVILGLQLRNVQLAGIDHEGEMSKAARKLELVFLKQRYGVTGSGANVSLDFYPAWDLYKECDADKSSDDSGIDTKQSVSGEGKRFIKAAEMPLEMPLEVREKTETGQNEFVPEDEYSRGLFEKFLSMPDEE